MNHKTKVNTSPGNEQANVVIAMLPFDAIRQQLRGLDSLGYTVLTLSEMSIEQTDLLCDLVSGVAASTAVARLDALARSICGSVALIQDAAAAVSLALEEIEGGAA